MSGSHWFRDWFGDGCLLMIYKVDVNGREGVASLLAMMEVGDIACLQWHGMINREGTGIWIRREVERRSRTDGTG